MSAPPELPDARIGSYFLPKGRVSRWQYFGLNLLNGLISVVAGAIAYGLLCLIIHEDISTSLPSSGEPIDLRSAGATYLGFGLYFYLTFILICKRLHDMNCSAWLAILFQLLLLVPGINLITGLVLLFAPGKNHPDENWNRYGFDPRS
jgi:uncharacterized membrane protein YhaH (DUF805 family)